MTNEEIVNIINHTKIIAIIRGIPKESLLPAVEALVSGGIRAVEITLNRSDAVDGIREIAAKLGEHITVGAGTVLTTEQVEAVADAGGRYIISPNTNVEVIRRTKELELISIPGALTPTEIVTAWTAGADYVKLFPAGNLGVGYLKALLSPLPDIPFLVVGGVGLDNIKDFLNAGACGAGIGGKLVDKQLIQSGRFDEITRIAAEYVLRIKS